MNRFLLAGLTLGLIGSAAYAVLPGDVVEGQQLHATNCTGCHDASVYMRKDRKVGSLDALMQQMDGCAHLAKKDFSMGEKQSLVKFLNERYYHFK